MKRWLKWLALGAAVLVSLPVLFVLSGFLLPSDIVLDVERELDASPEDLFELFSTKDGVERWWGEAMVRMDENFEVRHLEGPTSGAGMQVGFGPPGGDVLEHWTYTEADPPHRVKIDVDFQIFISHRTLEITPDGDKTRVHWIETATVTNPAFRWMLKLSTASAIENREIVLD